MSRVWLTHHSLESCADYLPKSKKYKNGGLAQCRICGQLYMGSPLGYGWIPTSLPKGSK